MGFIIFLSVFLSLYGGLHFYGLIKVRQALALGPGATVSLSLFMAIMIVAPVMVRLLEREGFESGARFSAFVGYTWMGLLFLFVSVSFAFDIYRLMLYLCRWILQSDLAGITLSHGQSFTISLILTIIISVYGVFEAMWIRTDHVTLKTSKIPQAIGKLTIAQISDIHLGLIVGEKRLKKILSKVKAANPDILISTGDLVDGQMDDISRLATLFREIPARFGKFAVTGNHEFYAGLDRTLNFTEKAGFTILRGEGIRLNGWLNIAGVDDMAGRSSGLAKEISEKALLANLPRENFTLLLKHRPLLDKDALGLFDLQISGHTHKGQIFPFSLITLLVYPKHAGLLKLDTDSHLYVSRGSGTWGPPIRFLSPPEVTLIELVHENRQ